jgi:translocation and assembly module TamB
MKHKAIIVIIALIAVIVGAVSLKGHEMLNHASQTLAQDLSAALGSKVTIGSIEITAFNTLTKDGVAVYDKQSQRFLTSDKMAINYSLWALLQGKPIAHAITEIRLIAPAVNVRQSSSGRWNYDDLLPSTPSSQSEFAGKVSIENGRLMIAMNDHEWQIDALDGIIDFAIHPAVQIELNGLRQGAKLSAVGRVDSQRLTNVTFYADGLTLEEYQSLYPEASSLHNLQGKLRRVNLTVQKNQGEVRLAGDAWLDGIAADIDMLRVQDMYGLVGFTNKDISFFDVSAKVYQQPIKVGGKILLDSTVPALALDVSSPGFDLSVLEADLPVQGMVSGQVNLRGLANNPVIDGSFSLLQGEVAGYPVTAATTKLHAVDRRLWFTDVEAKMLGGLITGSGMLELDSKSYIVSCTGKDVDTSMISEISPDISGISNFAIEVSGQGSLKGAAARGTIAIANGQAKGVPFQKLQAGFWQRDGHISIDYLNAEAGGGTATANGWIASDSGMLNMDIAGYGLSPALIAKLQDELPIAGQFDFSGHLTGSFEQPKVSGQFTAVNGEAFYQPFEKAAGTIRLADNELSLENVVLSAGQTKHLIQGSICLAGQQEINLSVASEKARAENIVKLFSPDEQLTGNVDNEVRLSGPLKNFNAQGHVVLTEGSFRGKLLAKAEGIYERQNGNIILKNFTINSLNTELLVSGLIAGNQTLNLDLKAYNVDLAGLQIGLPYPVSGKANFTGSLTGTVEYPEFVGELTAERLKFNGKDVINVSGRVVGQEGQINIPQLDFVQENGSFHFSGNFNAASRDVSGQLDVENGRLEFLLAAFNLPSQDISGRLNGQLVLGGTTNQPNAWLKGQLTEGQIKKYPLQNIEVDLELVNQILTVNKFTAQQGKGIVAARGTADLQGALKLEIEGRDIDAGLLSVWINPKLDAKGRLNFTAQIGGTTQEPHTAVSMDIAGGGVSTATFDSLYGLFIIDKNMIKVNQLFLTKGPYRASAYGAVPLTTISPQGKEVATDKDQINLVVKLDEADLSILPLLTKDVAWASGQTHGDIIITGNLRQPMVHGNFQVNDGTVKLSYLNEPLKKVGIDIQLDNDKINVKSFTGSMGQGGYHLSGTADLKGFALKNYQMELLLDKVGISNKYFKGPVDGTLKLTEQNGRPLLTGNVKFDQDLVNVPVFPELAQSELDVDLNVDVSVGRKVHFYNSLLYDFYATGKLNFAGSTKNPSASGHIRAIRGTVNYLRTPFKISQGRMEFAKFSGFEPIIKLKAQTKLEQTVVDLSINGPISQLDMQLKSDPPMRQQEILSLLTLRGRFFENQKNGTGLNYSGLGHEEAMSLLDAGLQMTFVSEVEGMFRNTLGLDEFKIRRGYFDVDANVNINRQQKEGYTVQLGKYLNDRFMVTQLIGLDHHEYKTSLRYDFSRRLSIMGSMDYQNNTYIGIETRFRFK